MNPNASVNKLFTTRCFITVKTFLYKHAGHYQVNGGTYCGEQLRCFLNISNWVKGLRESKVACHRHSLEDSIPAFLMKEDSKPLLSHPPTLDLVIPMPRSWTSLDIVGGGLSSCQKSLVVTFPRLPSSSFMDTSRVAGYSTNCLCWVTLMMYSDFPKWGISGK